MEINHIKRTRNIFVISCLILISLFYCYHSLMKIADNADISALLLESEAILQGNWLLKGWVLPPDSFWPLLLLPLTVKLFGISFAACSIVAAIHYCLIVCVCLMLAKNKKSFRESYPNLFLTFGIIGIPLGTILMVFVYPAGHQVNILYFMIGLIFLDHLSSSNKKGLYFSSIFFLVVLSVIGDPFSYLLVLGTLLVCGLRLYTQQAKKEDIYLILLLCLAVLTVKLILYSIAKLGGFQLHAATPLFSTFDNLSTNINHTLQATFFLFGVNFFGKPLFSHETICSLLRIPFLLLVVYAVILQVKNWRTNNDFISQILASTILVNLAACIFSDRMNDTTIGQYFYPLIMFGGALVGRSLQFSKKIQISLIALVLLSFILTLVYFPGLQKDRFAEMQNWLETNHYTHGFAGYGEAHSFTGQTNNNIKVRPVIWNGQKLVPFNWLVDTNWYIPKAQNAKVNFMILETAKEWGEVSMQNAIKTFGQPREIKKFDPFVILIWDKDLTQELGNPPLPPVP